MPPVASGSKETLLPRVLLFFFLLFLEYFELLEVGRPAIGTWFSKDFINYLAIDAGFEKCEIIDQPAYLINSGHCYDVRLTK